jgi:hypothetical protein
MAKKQTRRSISVSRVTYERLKAFCETNGISMSQFVETRVGDFLGDHGTTSVVPSQRPTLPTLPGLPAKPVAPKAETRPSAPSIPLTSAAARFAVEPPPPVIKPKQEQPAPKPTEKRPDQIFTF